MAFCAKCGTQVNDGAKFCPKCGAQIQQSSGGAIPTFTPPSNDIPTFTPPVNPVRHHNGPVCYHHPDEPAAGQCARCGKYICRDCVEAYTVTDGEYANQCLCYDCCQELVADNVAQLKKQKGKIYCTVRCNYYRRDYWCRYWRRRRSRRCYFLCIVDRIVLELD